jgi:signal peptidase I
MAIFDEVPEGASRARRDRASGSPRRRGVRMLRDILIILLAAVVLSFVIKTFLVRSFYIPSGSMENTLQIDDRILVNELVPKVIPLQRGDVVVFTDPGGWLKSEVPTTGGKPAGNPIGWLLTQVGLGTADSNDHLVKRVIGLPGDTVSCCNAFGQEVVNGVPLNEPYIAVPPGARAVPSTFSITVPPGDLWVEGDNRDSSADSAFRLDSQLPKYFVPIRDVVGRADIITWPVQRWARLSNYPLVFGGTDRGRD